MSGRELQKLTVLFAAASMLSSCSRPSAADGNWAACYFGTDAEAMCIETELKEADDKLYVLESCRGMGVMKDACPAERLAGICSFTQKTPTSKGFQPRRIRRHHYLHPDLTSGAAVTRLAAACVDGQEAQWMEPAP